MRLRCLRKKKRRDTRITSFSFGSRRELTQPPGPPMRSTVRGRSGERGQGNGIEPMTRPFDAKGDPLDYVVSKNLVRRHLDDGQRAMITAKISNLRRGTNQ